MSLFAQTQEYSLAEEDKLFTKVENVQILTTTGDNIKLSALYEREPVILALIFTRCTGVCSPLIRNLQDNLARLRPKEQFKILVVSFDSADKPTDMENYQKMLNVYADNKWIFGVTENILDLTGSVGFYPQWDSVSRQFEHDALLVGINGNGYIVKKLLGIRNDNSLNGLIKAISNEFVISYPLPRKNALFTCFTYDPITGERKLSLGLLILLIPAVGTIILLFLISRRKKGNTAL
ncbi:MAG: SCO family protein [Bacteroidia bacterium]|nr:SCO family protein [Bacteroidia bacterium]